MYGHPPSPPGHLVTAYVIIGGERTEELAVVVGATSPFFLLLHPVFIDGLIRVLKTARGLGVPLAIVPMGNRS